MKIDIDVDGLLDQEVLKKEAERYLKERCVEKVHNAVDAILENMTFNTRKFENLIVKEMSRMVAEKLMSKSVTTDEN